MQGLPGQQGNFEERTTIPSRVVCASRRMIYYGTTTTITSTTYDISTLSTLLLWLKPSCGSIRYAARYESSRLDLDVL